LKKIRKRGIRAMNVDNFKLNNVFEHYAKVYMTKPAIAAKYQP
jgi:hypothetical protein